MHFHNPEDNVSARQYVLHPDSWLVHPEGGYPVFQEEVCQGEPSFSDRRLNLSRHGRVPDQEVRVPLPLLLLLRRSRRNHAVSVRPE